MSQSTLALIIGILACAAACIVSITYARKGARPQFPEVNGRTGARASAFHWVGEIATGALGVVLLVIHLVRR